MMLAVLKLDGLRYNSHPKRQEVENGFRQSPRELELTRSAQT